LLVKEIRGEYKDNLCYLETIKAELVALVEINHHNNPLLKINSPNQPDKQAVVGAYICDWATEVACVQPDLIPVKCQHPGCNKTVHHLCQIAWEGMNRVEEDRCTTYCRMHNKF
jgi:hypothetical protein